MTSIFDSSSPIIQFPTISFSPHKHPRLFYLLSLFFFLYLISVYLYVQYISICICVCVYMQTNLNKQPTIFFCIYSPSSIPFHKNHIHILYLNHPHWTLSLYSVEILFYHHPRVFFALPSSFSLEKPSSLFPIPLVVVFLLFQYFLVFYFQIFFFIRFCVFWFRLVSFYQKWHVTLGPPLPCFEIPRFSPSSRRPI